MIRCCPFRLPACMRRLLWRARREDSGSALVELALSISLIGLPLLLGTIYTGVLLFYSIEVSNAAHAGAMYGMQSSTYASDTAGITSATQAEAPEIGTNLTVTPTTYYACSTALDGTQYSSQDAATSACASAGGHALEFIKVTTTYVATPFARIPGTQQTMTLSGLSVMEVQE